ncbi:hypothetical protein BD779DRAFT_1670592 [Infundibulicybe gibba]|nr:hypothetical protein BD779DRAFT_1670592 [Infundibulicybe gibba]
MSSVSLSISPSNPEHRELIRTATSMLCKEIVKPPVHVNRSESVMRDWEEVEVRTRALARLERVWGKSGGVASGSSTNLGSAAGMTSSGLSVAGEERERRLFCEALRDGFVLCQLINKLRSSSVVRPDIREDGIVRTSNVTKFLAACSSYGLPDEDLFQRDDFMEGTGESLARVAHTIIALIKFVDAPVIDRSKYLSGQVKKASSPSTTSGPYSQGSVSRGTASTPNLARGSSSPLPPSPTARRRWSPPTGLPTVRSNSPNDATRAQKHLDNLADQDGNSVITLRVRNIQKADDGGLFSWAINAASPSRSPTAGPPQTLIGDPPVNESPDESRDLRQSVASSVMTETTVTTAISSILDRQRTNSSSYNKYGTIRTVTTDLTSEAPSISRAEGSIIANDLASKSGKDNGSKPSRERKASEAPVVDLSRVAEETDESVSSKGQTRDKGKGKSNGVEQVKSQEATEKAAVHLHKGKWPDDFLNAFQARSQPRPIATISRTPDLEDLPNASSPISISPPRKLAIVGASRRNESHEELPQFPRRPTHRARHSVDAPALKPKESILRRDVSPDGVSGPSRVMLRRHSTKPAVPHRNGIYVARVGTEGSDNDPVPFPRATSGEHSGGSPSPRNSSGDDPSASNKPRLPRGRFQSEIEGAGSNRRGRPEPYGELGARPSRSRFESMVNLGVASSTASASDLISRDSMDGSAVRKTLVLKEDGKPPTHFQLGNCIGRGQFGSVYRALNLNTGQMVAVKRIRLEGLKEDEVTTLMREVDLVKSLSHPSIVKYEGMARDADTLSIILEYAENGSLGQTLKAFGKLNERLVASYVVKILEGLHYLHQSDVVHCDLKAANILTTKNGNVKLSDFGVSLNLRAMEREIKDVAGTPNWMAPRSLNSKALRRSRPPYAEIANSMSVMFRIVEDDMPPIPDGCSEMLQDFLVQCFNKDPSLRPSADLLCEHPWLKKNWGAHKELRPQDSIPFLRRVSADLHKSDVVRYFSQIDMPESPASDGFQRADDVNPPLIATCPIAPCDL